MPEKILDIFVVYSRLNSTIVLQFYEELTSGPQDKDILVK